MTPIRQLFDERRALNRPIEKVITYQNRTDTQLRTEVSEYVVTDHIESCFSDLLLKMQEAFNGEGNHEIGVWVSGFYGSGKSSFTKYLGFALDRGLKVEGKPFLQLLQNQLHTAQVKALMNQVAGTYDAAVIFLDLASEMLAGASMEDVSTVLHLKVLQWAGYSEDLKVAELERMLEKDGKLEKFMARAEKELEGVAWSEARNQPLVANQIAARLATEFYPKLFPKAEDFQNITLDVRKSEYKRAEEMVELVRRKSGKKNIVFIIDEVGQYVSAKPNLILNLDGLAKNLKQLGGGTVWLFATAQQTLTEDNHSAMLNAPGLFKLKDRFPIQVHLEASDIREICHKRLLTKSATGERELSTLFDAAGASLRTATSLKDAGVYDVDLTRKIFVDLYPFLPAHFEILLKLLGRLARRTGGLGLRSAIKVVQDVLIERGGKGGKQTALADAPVGTLANTVTFYDSLQRDIHTSFGYIVEGVSRVAERYPKEAFYLEVAKSIAVLQVLENLPVTSHNIAALLQPEVASSSQRDRVEAAVDTLLKDAMIPLGTKDGGLRFLTQAAVTLQKQLELTEFRQADMRAELNGVLRAIFKPLPSARLNNARPVTAGLKLTVAGGQAVSLEGEKEPIQLQVEFTPPGSYDDTRIQREKDSCGSRERATLFLLGRSEHEAEQLATTLVRCRKFLESHRTASDPEIQEFVRTIDEQVTRTASELERKLTASLMAGSFVAHGGHQAVAECGTTLLDAAKAFLGTAAARVFDRYAEAAVQADTALAETFLKTPLDRITSADDPLGLVIRPGGRSQIKLDHKALVSIKDYLGQNGLVEGRRLLDHFSDPPFGWSKDTIRYLLAAAFLGSEIKLRIAGKDCLVKGDEALKAFVSNKAIGPVGITLRNERPDPDALLRASDRLKTLTGEAVLPLEDDIASAAKKHFAIFQSLFSPLAVELRSVGLLSPAHAERAENLSSDLAEIVSGDGSDAVTRLGGQTSPLYEALVWAKGLRGALDKGLRDRLKHLSQVRAEIDSLPDSGIPGELKAAAAPTLAMIAEILAREAFFSETATLATAAEELDLGVDTTVKKLATHQRTVALLALERLQTSPDWSDLSADDRGSICGQIDALAINAEGGLGSLKRLIAHEYSLHEKLRELTEVVANRAKLARDASQPADEDRNGAPEEASITLLVPALIKTPGQIDLLTEELRKLRTRVTPKSALRITWKLVE